MPDYEPVLLRRVGKPGSQSIDGYIADGGYQALEKAVTTMTPEQVIDTVKSAGLRGRGGAGFPTGVKWTFLPKGHPGPIYLCVNGDESEPCTFNNRVLMEEDPHQFLEGVILTAYAVRAWVAYIYLRYEYGRSFRVLQQAIDDAYAKGYLGYDIFGKGFNLQVYLHRGAGAYICGEETGLIESLEGKRAWPRIKPPFPAVEGAFRKPTIVNNIETLACVTHIVQRGPDWFKSIGVPPDPKNPRDAGSYGPKLFNISGHVNKPGTIEAPLGITVRELIEKYGGGVWKGRKAKGAIPGGISMGIITEKEFDMPLDFNGPGKVACLGLGTGAVTVFDEETSIVDVLYNITRFFSHESCGQCTPCREGTGWMYKILDRIRRGQGRREDLQILDEVAKNIGIMPGTTICGLADGAGWPVKNAVQKFRDELEGYIKQGKKTTSLTLVGAH
ncbi:MAG: NADH-quinone oxidoreductase subunit NuoF [Planctomycetia bacterium]|nr:NADH-quinone oxidoreductase subunit NuoF [Planctomycetia bacterium]